MDSKLRAVTDAIVRPALMFPTAGQRSDYGGARALLDDLPEAKHMLADHGHDADWYRKVLNDKPQSNTRAFEHVSQISASGRAAGYSIPLTGFDAAVDSRCLRAGTFAQQHAFCAFS